ncbi:MAG: hypothetical protein IPG92_19120 [Flavobacteriales bacterium]|nr:hypothetical protein [Flavobacteriales bacterium]
MYLSACSHLDSDIRLEREEVMNNLDQNDSTIIINRMPEWEEAEHAQVEVNPTFIQLVNARGVSIFRSANLRDDQFLFERTEQEERFFNTTLEDQHLRQGQFTVRNNKGAVLGYLTIGVSQEESITVLHNLLITLLLMFPVVLIVLYAARSFAARRSIAPVHAMITAASGMNSASISERLPLPAQQNEFHPAGHHRQRTAGPDRGELPPTEAVHRRCLARDAHAVGRHARNLGSTDPAGAHPGAL